ncbi:MAG: efflux RND transporter permease subunit [Paludibacteraceae bacterium]
MISTSVTLAIVFVPVIFLQGFTGRLFREFGIVVMSAILISALVSLTLTPVLNVFLGSSNHNSRFYEVTEPFFVGTEKKYRRFLAFFIQNRWISYTILALCILMIITIGKTLKSELAPLEDHSSIRTTITAPEGTEYTTTQHIINKIANINMDSVPEARYVLARYAGGGGGGSSSVNSGFVNMFLTDPSERKISQQEIYNKLSKIYSSIPDARIIPSQEPTISTSGGRGLPVQFVIQNLDFEKIKAVLPIFLDEAQK